MNFNFKLEDIRYVKILYKNADEQACVTKATIKRVSEREILACVKYDDGLLVLTPQEVVLSIVCNDGLYRTKTVLKSVENDEPYVFFILEPPVGIEYQQNREYFRVSVKYNCIFKFEENGEIKEISAQTYDISANGVSIILSENLVTEALADIEIGINNQIVTAKVRYIRSEKFESGYKISLMFAKISEFDRDYISQTCLHKQLREQRMLFLDFRFPN